MDKAGDRLAVDCDLRVEDGGERYVSRGAWKLEHALERFGLDVVGRRAADIGAATGGFTDCLLQAGAEAVVAVDVGRGQLAGSLRGDPRVTFRPGTNARRLTSADLGEPAPDLVVIDVSFIALTKVLPAVVSAAPAAELVALVKPQFEAGRRDVGKGGVVRDPATWRRVLGEVADCLASLGHDVLGATASPIAGPAGNREFLVHARPGSGQRGGVAEWLDTAVGEALPAGQEGGAEGGEPGRAPTRGGRGR